MEQMDVTRFLITTIEDFIEDRLNDKEQRARQKEHCAERLAAEDGSSDRDGEVRYSDQAVLANLDWGIDALEEAINTSNVETKLARLDYAEKMLQVCAMLNSKHRTAGVPNFYLSAWAHLNLSYLWKLRNNIHNSVLHVLEMFMVDPFFSRVDFAPELWKELFLPHMSSIVGWYSESRHRLMLEVIPDSSDLSFTADLDQFFNETLISSMSTDQAEKLQELEQLYGESLDENTRLFAKYYKDGMNSDTNTGRRIAPMMPIAEPPMTPLNEVSRSIPDFVRFGPILPKNAGFSAILQSRHNAKEGSRLNIPLTANLEESGTWEPQEAILEETEEDDEIVYEEKRSKFVPLNSMRVATDGNNETGTSSIPSKANSRTQSPSVFSPSDSPRDSSPKVYSPTMSTFAKKEPMSMLRLLSSRVMGTIDTSLPAANDFRISSPGSDGELMAVQKTRGTNLDRTRSMSYDNVNSQLLDSPNNESDGSQSFISLPMSERLSTSSRPPKDFVCPITGHLFNDPVTLETGQTYERKAIQEWLQRGNTTCPITRQPLSSNSLPKTNYVLRRLITSWKDQHPELSQEFSYSETPRNSLSPSFMNESSFPSNHSNRYDFPSRKRLDNHLHQRTKRFMQPAVSLSPTSVISQATSETIINGLKPYVSTLCTSENLQECEEAVLAIAKLWKDSKGDPGVQSFLSKPTILNGFVEILSESLNREVLRTSIYILSELTFLDESIGETLTRVDSDFECLASLLKNGLAEAAVLIHQLRPAFAQLSNHDFIPSLVQIIQNKSKDAGDLPFLVDSKDAAIAILEQVLTGGDENSQSLNAIGLISANGIPVLIKCLDSIEARKSIVSILICCMRADKSCRNLIASRIELSPVLELFHSGNDSARDICMEFLWELVKLNRRTSCNKILQVIKDEGAFSTMHTFLVYLQMAPMEQQPSTAGLLLQLDLLVEPRKMSIYREEAVEALIEAMNRKEFPNNQLSALDALITLSGRLTFSGKSYMETWLLKVAGFDQPYNALMKSEWNKKHETELTETMENEEKTTSSWEKRVSFVLCNHEKGLIFKALEECFKSNSLEMAKSCLVISTWLVYMLSILPDTGVKVAARKSLLEEFVNVLQSSRNVEEKILATLALKTFVTDPAAFEELGKYATCIYKTLRKLKRTSPLITDLLKSLMNLSCVNATELWNCTEVEDIDSSSNGEVLSLLHLKGRIISSHSDGTIKVWDAGKKVPRLMQEVREHTKAVTCLCVPPSGEKLYSGSLDKSIRVWAIKPEGIHCIQVHDVKEAVYELAANSKVACYISQGTGVKVYNWSGFSKHINFNKTVKCLALINDKLYCGSSGYSIQELDLGKLTTIPFYSGTRKLLGKQSIFSLEVHNGLLIAGGSSVDGTAGKVFNHSTKVVIGSFSTGFDIMRIAVTNDFMFTATKCGIIEVWLRERVSRVSSIKVNGGNSNTKITSLTSDSDGAMLYAGSSDGRILAWSLD